jgi:hypothetical protein
MTNSPQTKPMPTPALLVYGKPPSPGLPQASWFRAEDRGTVVAAAQGLKFAVIDIRTEADQALIAGVHEGVLKANGRMIVGSVAADVFRRIEEHAAKMAAALGVKTSDDTGEVPKASPEQTTNTDEKMAASASPDPWSELRIGSYAICKHWLATGAANGWWLAVITDIDGDDFVVRWPDEPLTPPLKIERKHIAIFHPSYDIKREWDRRR